MKHGNKSKGKKTQIKTGSICNNDGMKKSSIIGFIQNTNKQVQKGRIKKKIIISESSSVSNSGSNNNTAQNINYKDVIKTLLPTKEFLCFELETYFKYLDLIDTKQQTLL